MKKCTNWENKTGIALRSVIFVQKVSDLVSGSGVFLQLFFANFLALPLATGHYCPGSVLFELAHTGREAVPEK